MPNLISKPVKINNNLFVFKLARSKTERAIEKTFSDDNLREWQKIPNLERHKLSAWVRKKLLKNEPDKIILQGLIHGYSFDPDVAPFVLLQLKNLIEKKRQVTKLVDLFFFFFGPVVPRFFWTYLEVIYCWFRKLFPQQK